MPIHVILVLKWHCIFNQPHKKSNYVPLTELLRPVMPLDTRKLSSGWLGGCIYTTQQWESLVEEKFILIDKIFAPCKKKKIAKCYISG